MKKYVETFHVDDYEIDYTSVTFNDERLVTLYSERTTYERSYARNDYDEFYCNISASRIAWNKTWHKITPDNFAEYATIKM